jgi:outer membrane protein assembly complex protein YaeT
MLDVAVPGGVRAQDTAAAYVDKPVTGVAILIEEKPSADPSLIDLLDTKVGAPLRMSDVRESITHLYGMARFEDVRVDAANTPGGVALTYRLEPIHPVTKVQFRGDLQMGDSVLRNRMADRFGATPPASRATEVATVLEQLYQERGYLKATVKPAPPILEHEPDRATLVFDVEAGPRAQVAKVGVEGRPLDPVPSILTQLGLATGDAYEPAELRSRIDKYVQSMRRRGYYQAAVTDSRQVSADGRDVTVTINVNPGPAVTVRFQGDSLPKEKVADLVPIEREGSVDPDLIEDSAERIRDYFRAQGYWKADVKTDRQENDGRLSIVFTISRGVLYHVAPGGIDVSGNKSVPTDRIRTLLRLNAGDPFVAARLDLSVTAIQGIYQSEGFANVQVKSQPNEIGPGLVKPVIVIAEGPRTLVGTVSVEGNRAFATPALLAHVESKPGAVFYAPRVRADRDAILQVYLDSGYQSAQVNEETAASADGRRADLHFKVVEGPQAIVDHILIVGNARTKTSVIQRELQFAPGKPLGVADVLESRRRLSALGLFRRVDITELAHGSATHRDVLITVEEALQTTIGYGGGGQLDRRLRPTGPNNQAQEAYEFAPRGFFEISRRNLGGRNRTASLYTRISLRPNDQVGDTSLFGFSEYRVVGTYIARQVLPGGGDFTSTAAVEQGVRSSFNFTRKGVNADFTRQLSPRVRTSVRYALSTTHVFDQNFDPGLDPITFDRVFGQVRLSTFSGAVARDTRDDLLEPQRGTLLSVDASFAAKAIGSEAGYLKSLAEAFVYRNLGRPYLVWASGVRLGAANAFERTVDTPEGPTVIRELPASERFFAGGDTTIRGYATDTVGAPNTIASTGFPAGGNAMIILNTEVRVPVYHGFGAVAFIDGGNVFLHTTEMSLAQLRGSVGFGLRYRSPVGPIRLDLGFKLDRRTIGGRLEPRTVLHFSIGQAF